MVKQYYALQSFEPERSVGYLIKRCWLNMAQLAERGFVPQPISFTEWTILTWLAKRPHWSPTELSTHTGHDMGALTRLVDELERNALVRRERDQADRRAVQIAITPEGRRVMRTCKRIAVDLSNRLLEPYSEVEIDSLISLLQRFMAQTQETLKAGPAIDHSKDGRAATKTLTAQVRRKTQPAGSPIKWSQR